MRPYMYFDRIIKDRDRRRRIEELEAEVERLRVENERLRELAQRLDTNLAFGDLYAEECAENARLRRIEEAAKRVVGAVDWCGGESHPNCPGCILRSALEEKGVK